MDTQDIRVGDVVEVLSGWYADVLVGTKVTVKEVEKYSPFPIRVEHGGEDYIFKPEEVSLVSAFVAIPPRPEATKDTNPKDAIGDKKVPLWLCSPIAKAQWAVAQFVGMVKYGAWNWREAGVRSSIYLSAMQRHMDAYMSGEEVDPVDGTPHLGHIMACAAILIDAKAAGKLTDDRPPSVGLRSAYAEVGAQMVKARENYGHMAPKHYTIADTQWASPARGL